MKKKTLAFVLALLVCVSFAAGATQAYFTSQVATHNVITTGGVSVVLHEQQADGTAYPRDPVKAMPGSVITKKAFVENLDADAYIRAKYTLQVRDPKGKVIQLTQAELEDLIIVTGTDSRWKDCGDGWLYYSEVLNNSDKKTTGYLLTTVELSGPNITSKYAGCSFDVIVQAQAVQAKNNQPKVEGNLSTLGGWPAES